MAGGDELLGGSDVARVGGALLFLGAGTNVYDAFSAVMSSPWSTEKFTSSPEEAKMAKEYVRHAIGISWLYALGSALIVPARLKLYPVAGAGIVTVYMHWLYRRAVKRGTSPGGMTAGMGSSSDALVGSDSWRG